MKPLIEYIMEIQAKAQEQEGRLSSLEEMEIANTVNTEYLLTLQEIGGEE